MSLPELRREIDRIDQALADLLCRRAAMARRIGEAKLRARAAIHDPEREGEVLKHVVSLAREPLNAADLKRIFRTIMAVCTRVQKSACGRR